MAKLWSVKEEEFLITHKTFMTYKEISNILNRTVSALQSHASKMGVTKVHVPDESGNKYGRLTVLKRVENDKDRHAQWLCKCECGNTTKARGSALRSGKRVSCGCAKKSSRLPNKAAFRRVYRRYKEGAKKRNLAFNLDKKTFKKIVTNDCHYCGAHLPNKMDTIGEGGKEFKFTGLDRKNSSKEYYEDNVVACCSECNRMKNDMEYEKFLNRVQKISNNWGDYVGLNETGSRGP